MPSMSLSRSGSLLGALLLGSLALTGCGGSAERTDAAESTSAPTPTPTPLAELAPAEILARSKAVTAKATSVHIEGDMVSGGEKVSIDMDVKGEEGASGTVSAQGVTFRVLRIGTDAYLKAPDGFWADAAGPEAARVMEGKWLKAATTDEQFADFADFTTMKALFADFFEPTGKVTKVAGKPVAGASTVGLDDDDPEEGGVLYIATEGEPFPLLVEPGAGTGDSGSVTLSEFNAPVTLTAPPAAQVVDQRSLAG